jgi:hypothetical protein
MSPTPPRSSRRRATGSPSTGGNPSRGGRGFRGERQLRRPARSSGCGRWSDEVGSTTATRSKPGCKVQKLRETTHSRKGRRKFATTAVYHLIGPAGRDFEAFWDKKMPGIRWSRKIRIVSHQRTRRTVSRWKRRETTSRASLAGPTGSARAYPESNAQGVGRSAASPLSKAAHHDPPQREGTERRE